MTPEPQWRLSTDCEAAQFDVAARAKLIARGRCALGMGAARIVRSCFGRLRLHFAFVEYARHFIRFARGGRRGTVHRFVALGLDGKAPNAGNPVLLGAVHLPAGLTLLEAWGNVLNDAGFDPSPESANPIAWLHRTTRESLNDGRIIPQEPPNDKFRLDLCRSHTCSSSFSRRLRFHRRSVWPLVLVLATAAEAGCRWPWPCAGRP